MTGLRVFLNPVQDVRAGGRAEQLDLPVHAEERQPRRPAPLGAQLADAMKRSRALTDVDTDQQENGVETYVDVDRDSAPRGSASRASAVDNALYNAFGQRQVATIYNELNQYHVVMEWAPRIHAEPERARRRLRAGDVAREQRRRVVATERAATTRCDVQRQRLGAARRHGCAAGLAKPGAARRVDRQRAQQHADAAWCRSSAIATFVEQPDADVGQPPGRRARDDDLVQPRRGRDARRRAQRRSRRPRPTSACRRNVRGSFPGTALRGAAVAGRSRRLLIVAALVVIYIVLGMLYESLVHPVTVLSTLPSAGRRRGAGAAAVPDGVLDHRADRRVPADRHRQEERDPDHRLRARGRARARPVAVRRGARGVPAALPADPDDDAGRSARRAAAGDRLRRRRGAAPAARRRDHRRPDRQPAADAADHAGRLPAARQAAPARRRRAALEPRRRSRRSRFARAPPHERAPRGLAAAARGDAGPAIGLRGRPGLPATGCRRCRRRSRKRRRQAIDVVPGGARRCARPRAVVGAVRRPGAVGAREPGRGVEPERRRGGRRVRAGAGAGARAARRAVPGASGSTRRATRSGGQRRGRQAAATCGSASRRAGSPTSGAQLRLGGDRRAGECRGERGGSRRGDGCRRRRRSRSTTSRCARPTTRSRC